MEQNVNKKMSKSEIRDSIVSKLSRYYAINPDEATELQMYKTVSLCVKDELTKKAAEFKNQYKKQNKSLPCSRIISG